MSLNQSPLANSELAIMDLLWDNERITARQIREELYSDTSKSQHGTVQRLLQRLEEKGYLARDHSEFVHQFMAKVSRQAYAGKQLESLASKLTSGSFAPLITHLVEAKNISSEDIEQIKAILEKSSAEGGKDD